MNIKFTRSQINILSVLIVVIVILITGIIFLPAFSPDPASGGKPTDETPITPQHEKFRNARVAFNENLYWETNLGSSGEDITENMYELDSKIYIIGTVGAADLDFADAGTNKIFLMILSLNGTPLSYHFYPGNIIQSMLFDDGIFVAAQSADGSKNVFTVKPDGSVKNSKTLLLNKNETVVKIIPDYYTGRIVFFLNVKAELPPVDRLRIVEFHKDFEIRESCAISHVYDLNFIDAYQYGSGYIVAAGYQTINNGGLLIYEWRNGTVNLKVHDCTIAGRRYTPKKIVPYPEGFAAAVIDSNNIPDVLLIGTDFKPAMSAFLHTVEASEIDIFCDNTYYYVHTLSTSGIASAKRFSLYFKNASELAPFNFALKINAFALNASDTFFAYTKAGGPAMLVLNNQGAVFETSFGSATDKPAAILPFKGFIITAVHSKSVSIDVGKNFGGTDVWVTKVKF